VLHKLEARFAATLDIFDIFDITVGSIIHPWEGAVDTPECHWKLFF
jgi:hypothetical protein